MPLQAPPVRVAVHVELLELLLEQARVLLRVLVLEPPQVLLLELSEEEQSGRTKDLRQPSAQACQLLATARICFLREALLQSVPKTTWRKRRKNL